MSYHDEVTLINVNADYATANCFFIPLGDEWRPMAA